MIDVVNGKNRVRAWPSKRGKKKTAKQQQAVEKFTQIQRAAKYVEPLMMLDIMNAREGTPLLPRDVLTAMLSNRLVGFQTVQQKVLYPMAALIDVSNALDAISQTPGATLKRGQTYWEESPPSGNLGWTVVADQVITAPTAVWQSPDLTLYDEIMIVSLGLTSSAAGGRIFQMKDAITGQWLTAANAYTLFSAAGTITVQDSVGLTTGTAATAQYGAAIVTGLKGTKPAFVQRLNRNDFIWIPAKVRQLGQLRLSAGVPSAPAANLTGGRVLLMGR